MAERLYTLRGKSLTAAQVADLDNPTDDEKRAFAQQAGMSDQRLKEIEAMVEAVVPPLREFIEKSIRPLADRIGHMQRKITELEERPPAEWEIYDPSKTYKAGVFVTYAGSMFFARSESKGVKPGSGDACWKLCVKRGSAS